MIRLSLFALTLAAGAAALPAAAQEAEGPANEKVNQVIVYGDDKCEASSPDEIVVCNRLPEQDRYRVPQIFRGGDPLDPRNQAWLNRVTSMERVGRFGTDRSEEHTSALQSLLRISYAVFCLKQKNTDYTLYTSDVALKNG